MVNTLANHGYLPHDGVNISLADLITAFSDAINLDEAATVLVGVKALETSTTGDSSTFNLDDLDTHGSMFLPSPPPNHTPLRPPHTPMCAHMAQVL